MHNPFHIKLFERAFDIYTEWKDDWKNVAKGLSRKRKRERENLKTTDVLTVWLQFKRFFVCHCFGIFEMKPNHTLRNKHHTHATFPSFRWWMHKAEQKSWYAFLNLIVSLQFFFFLLKYFQFSVIDIGDWK